MIEINFPDKATMYDSPCARCGEVRMGDSLLVTCDKALCYHINEYLQNHPNVSITSG